MQRYHAGPLAIYANRKPRYPTGNHVVAPKRKTRRLGLGNRHRDRVAAKAQQQGKGAGEGSNSGGVGHGHRRCGVAPFMQPDQNLGDDG